MKTPMPPLARVLFLTPVCTVDRQVFSCHHGFERLGKGYVVPLLAPHYANATADPVPRKQCVV
jgi:hypothetical protein